MKKFYLLSFLALILLFGFAIEMKSAPCCDWCETCVIFECGSCPDCSGTCTFTYSADGCWAYGTCEAGPCVCPSCPTSSVCSPTTPCHRYNTPYSCDASTCPNCVSGTSYYTVDDSCGGCDSGYACSGGSCVSSCTCPSCPPSSVCSGTNPCHRYNTPYYCDASTCPNCVSGTSYYTVDDSCGGCDSGYACSGGSCVSSCTDECSPSGSIRCIDSTTYQTCGNYDADACLEWSSDQICSSGVCSESDGGCVPPIIEVSGGRCAVWPWIGEDEVCPIYGVDNTGTYCCYLGYGTGPECIFGDYDGTKESCDPKCVGNNRLYNGYNICFTAGWECDYSTSEDCSDESHRVAVGASYSCCDDLGESECTCQDYYYQHCDDATATCVNDATVTTIRTNCTSCGTDECAGLPNHWRDYYCDSGTGACDYDSYCSLACEAECVSPGVQTQDCGNCGTQTCTSACTWGPCTDEGICSPGATQDCGDCGTQTCSDSCAWGSCEDEGVCSPGAVQGCGDCGTQTCSDFCTWGACTGEGVCSPGASQCCGGNKTQICQSTCSWGSCSCLKDSCGAECSSAADCDDGNPMTADTCEADCTCLNTLINQPPDQPGPAGGGDGINWYHCTVKNKSIPVFNWTYSDPDGDPMGAYEIEVDEDSTFTAPKFNHLVTTESTSYALDLYHDDEEPDDLPSSMQDYQLDWASTYYWRVKVQDDQGDWSIWSNPISFNTPLHAYPWPDFSWDPSEPSQEEVVIFTPDETGYAEYLWTFNDGDVMTYNCVDSTFEQSVEPHVKFLITDNTARLRVEDVDGYYCESDTKDIEAGMPLPEYKEVSPFTWLKKMFAMMIDFFNGGF